MLLIQSDISKTSTDTDTTISIGASLLIMHDCDTYFNAWPRFIIRTIYILGGPLMTTYLVRPDHLCTRTKYLVTYHKVQYLVH